MCLRFATEAIKEYSNLALQSYNTDRLTMDSFEKQKRLTVYFYFHILLPCRTMSLDHLQSQFQRFGCVMLVAVLRSRLQRSVKLTSFNSTPPEYFNFQT